MSKDNSGPERLAQGQIIFAHEKGGETRRVELFSLRITKVGVSWLNWQLDGSNNDLDEFRISFIDESPVVGLYDLSGDSRVWVSFAHDSPDGGELIRLENGHLKLDEVSTEHPYKFRGTFEGNATESFSLKNGQFMLQEKPS